jgi:hypothetical protein
MSLSTGNAEVWRYTLKIAGLHLSMLDSEGSSLVCFAFRIVNVGRMMGY